MTGDIVIRVDDVVKQNAKRSNLHSRDLLLLN